TNSLSRTSTNLRAPIINKHTRPFSNSSIKMGLPEIANIDEFYAAKRDNKIVVLNASASWCGPCKAIAPAVEKLAEKHTAAKFLKFDIDEIPDLAAKLGIQAVPTFFVFKDDQELPAPEEVSSIIPQVRGANPPRITALVEKAVE
ncbi:thioredoxin, partial [Bisporella sp. PMI_857]